MKRSIIILCTIAAVALASVRGYSQDLSRGRIIYEAHCFACHGPGGKGDGPSVHALIPKPPDFTDPAIKASLTKEKLAEVIANGKTGTQMIGWKDKLSPEEIQAVVEYVQSLR